LGEDRNWLHLHPRLSDVRSICFTD